ncbi:IPT/TIG domain-containing protein [Thermosediminibacter litoriperuensis]|uniref:IPT/TIG domain-containing protein n=1 Tax=Thermosediminibacter litoriperuensis TaxID=291989 RepID=A0A5S5AWX9_9FIRM|nr:IPT/TIG domain-containing protein [Thermosediminibacter litoriperuensis]TYP57472.1 IPT/TIG domain-containing protein [Thermosediminibacter litoriperuensis]
MLSRRLRAFIIIFITISFVFNSLPAARVMAAAPTITGINPTSGTAAGGTLVTIEGTNFAPANQVKVLFGSAEGKVVSVSSDGTVITVTTPSYPQLGHVNVTVKNSETETAVVTNGYKYEQSSPQITGVSPLSGTAGTEITITGNEFMKDIDSSKKLLVLIGGILSTKVTFVSPTTIKAVVPAQVSGYKEIRVENPDGGSYTYFPVEDSKKFFYQKSTPTITSVDPNKGPVNTATPITIKGTNFIAGNYPDTSTPVTTVTIGGQPALDVVVVNENTITAKTPSNISITGPQHVIVTVDGVNAIKENGFTFISKPVINSLSDTPQGVSPSQGSVLGGTTVTINGSGFMAGAQVKFGGLLAQNISVKSDSVITATVPATSTPGSVAVTVTNPDGGTAVLNNGFTYTQSSPLISSISNTLDGTGPAEGSVLGGETIYIKGTGFGSDGYPDEVKVYIGGKLCTNVVLNKGTGEDIISAVTPSSTAEGLTTLKVVNKDGGTATANFTYIRSKPAINDFNPKNSSTVKQDTITINGQNFMEGAKVYFGVLEAKNVVVSPDGTSITATIPEASSAGLVDLKVVNPDQGTATAATKFQYEKSNPAIDKVINVDIESLMGVETNTGGTAGGTPIRIEGRDFSNAVQVTIGGKPAANVKVVKEDSNKHIITATTPANDVGDKTLVVTNPDGGSASTTFRYVVAPTVTGITPNTGTTEGGTTVVIDGTGFATDPNQVKVFFGGAEAEVLSASSTQIVVMTPANSEGAKDVAVINLTDYGSFVKKSGFTYVLPPSNPSIESIEPTSGSTAGGTEITVIGHDIRSGAKLYIGGNPATVISVEVQEIDGVYKSVLKGITPAGSAGDQEVKVVNPDGNYAVSPKPFTYRIPEKALSITSITPNKGSVLGGTQVTVKGANFVKRTQLSDSVYRETRLTIGGNEASGVVVSDDLTSLTAVTPGGRVGPQDVIVKVVKMDESSSPETEIEIESQAVLKGGFTYELPKSRPEIDYVKIYNPQTKQEEDPTGPTGGGSIVRIYGSDFIAQSGGKTLEVYFGTRKASIVEVVNPGLIQAVSPPSTQVGAVDVKVVNPDGAEAVLWGGFIYKGNNLVITSITPNSATVTGMVYATVTGANFIQGTQVTIGGEAALNVTVVDSTRITLIVPANTPGTKDVVVSNAYGSATLKGGFQYYVEQSRPSIDAVTPDRGSAAGGELVTITGENFMSGARVLIGGVEATGVVVKSTTEITARSPAGTPGYRDVTVVNPDEGTAVLPGGFLYISSPVIESVTPARGPVTGGMFIEIRGKNFETQADVHFVGNFVYGGNNYIPLEDVKVVSDTLIKAKVPASPGGYTGYVDLEVINPDGGRGVKQSAYLYKNTYTQPHIFSITPNRGPVQGGTEITIKGQDFESDALVAIGDAFATDVKYVDSTTLTAKTPPGKEGSADVQVINQGDGGFAVKAGGFTYTLPRSSPTITKVTPPVGSSEGGTPVTITGTDFRENISVIIGGVEVPAEDVNLISPTEIRIVTPRAQSYGKKDVVVVNEDGGTFTLKNGYEYVPPATIPVISGITPQQGTIYGGTLVKITGARFVKGAKVYFGGVEAPEVTVDDTGTLATAVTPAYKTGSGDTAVDGRYPVKVVLVNPDGGLVTFDGAFEFTIPESSPKITGIAPAKGPASGSTLVTIEGLDFRPGAAVMFGNAEALVEKIEDENGRLSGDPAFVTGTRITAVTPPGTPGKVDVRVINPDGGLAVLSKGYEYLSITGQIALDFINPTEGAVSGGTPFTIKGSGFVNPVTVYFGGEEAKGATAVDSNTITGRTPANTPGKKDVVVLNGNGLSGALKDGFEYKVPEKYPRIIQVDPNRGPAYGGIEVNIYGENFLSNAAVYIGENRAEVLMVQPGQIRIILPQGTLGPKDVIVINPDTGLDVLEEGFTYVDYPKIEKVEPAEGPVEGGTEITITGKLFNPGAVVLIGGKNASDVTVIGDTTIKAKTPPHSAGYKDVTVINPDGGEATLKDGFYYRPPRTRPDTPEDFWARRIDETAVMLSWSASLNANYYEIYGSTSSGGPFKYIDKTADTHYIVTGLEPDTKYYFRIRAVNELGFSGYTYADYAYTDEGEVKKLVELPADVVVDRAGGRASVIVKDVKYLKKEDYRVTVKTGGIGKYREYSAVLPYSLMSEVNSLTLAFDEVSLRISPSSLNIPAFQDLTGREKEDSALLITVRRPDGAKKDELLKFREKGMKQLGEIVCVEFSYRIGKETGRLEYMKAWLYIDFDHDAVYSGKVKDAGLYRYNPEKRRWEVAAGGLVPYSTSGGYIQSPGWYSVFGR